MIGKDLQIQYSCFRKPYLCCQEDEIPYIKVAIDMPTYKGPIIFLFLDECLGEETPDGDSRGCKTPAVPILALS